MSEIEIKKAIRPGTETAADSIPETKKKTPKSRKILSDKPKASAKDKLSPAHKAFIKEYVKNLGNATRAYLEAFPNVKENSARTLANRLLTKVNVKQAIKEEYELYWKNKDSEIEKSKTYQLIHSLGSTPISDIIDMADRTLVVKDLKDIPPESVHAIKSLDYQEKETANGIDRSIKVVLHDKLSALKLRAQMQGILKEENETIIEINIQPAERPAE